MNRKWVYSQHVDYLKTEFSINVIQYYELYSIIDKIYKKKYINYLCLDT